MSEGGMVRTVMGTPDHHLDWDDVSRLAARLASSISAATGVQSFDRIIGVARGGLVPAVLVASQLGVKRVETVQVRLYDGAVRLDAPRVVGVLPAPAGPSGDPTRTLVVDEILDSGATLRFLQTSLPEARYGALVARQASEGAATDTGLLRCTLAPEEGPPPRPVWVATGIVTEAWVLFPWSPPEDLAARAGGA